MRTRLRQRLLAHAKRVALALGEWAFNTVAVGPLDGLRRSRLLARLRVHWRNAMTTECTADDVVEILAALEQAGLPSWLGGGWAVDALVGHQTRTHTDLDLVVRREDVDRILDVLTRLGFRRVVARHETGDLLEHHAAQDPAGRLVDLHVVDLLTWPARHLEGGPFARGTVGGRPVDCLSAAAVQFGCRAAMARNDHKPEYYMNLRLLDAVTSREP